MQVAQPLDFEHEPRASSEEVVDPEGLGGEPSEEPSEKQSEEPSAVKSPTLDEPARKIVRDEAVHYWNPDKEFQRATLRNLMSRIVDPNRFEGVPDKQRKLRMMTSLFTAAQAEVKGEATKLMRDTKALTIRAVINNPVFAEIVGCILDSPDFKDCLGMCTYHPLVLNPWPGINSEYTPDAVMCCFTPDNSFEEPDPDVLTCEMSFLKKGKLLYVDDIGDKLIPEQEGESSAYLGLYKSYAESARDFQIGLHFKFLKCTPFKTASSLCEELARRASVFYETF